MCGSCSWFLSRLGTRPICFVSNGPCRRSIGSIGFSLRRPRIEIIPITRRDLSVVVAANYNIVVVNGNVVLTITIVETIPAIRVSVVVIGVIARTRRVAIIRTPIIPVRVMERRHPDDNHCSTSSYVESAVEVPRVRTPNWSWVPIRIAIPIRIRRIIVGDIHSCGTLSACGTLTI